MDQLNTKTASIQAKAVELLTSKESVEEAKKEVAAAMHQSDNEVKEIQKKILTLLNKVELWKYKRCRIMLGVIDPDHYQQVYI